MRLAALAALGAALLLAGCEEDIPASTKLPPMPSDLARCLKGVDGVTIPKRKLTVGDVERLWKEDRLRHAVMRQCGARATAWYSDLRRKWR